MNCAIIGAGVIGSATALALTQTGAKVTLFDRFDFGHDHGSSHGPTRLFRTAYFEHPDYVPLLKRAQGMWRALQAAAGEQLVFETGVVETGPPDGFVISGVRRAAREHKLHVETLNRTQLEEKCPGLAPPSSHDVLFEREAGFLRADMIINAQLGLAHNNGAIMRPGTNITSWHAGRDGVRVETPSGTEKFDRLIIACGPWANDMLGDVGVKCSPVAKALFWRRTPNASYSNTNGFTPFAVETDDARMFYGFPAIDEDGVKFGEHTGGAALAGADDRPATPTNDDIDSAEAFLGAFIRPLAGKADKHAMCTYAMSPDGHFVIDRHPLDAERVCFAAGLSGHGFKFAPVIAEALARMAVSEDDPDGFAFLSLKRFTEAGGCRLSP
ncbi:MAG: N-methyl-L-tryptophan oxidase [Parvularculaceae bacterium]|nr:N-methyl-L-tryptophan oxidase [Parvularculaceae bacterium]